MHAFAVISVITIWYSDYVPYCTTSASIHIVWWLECSYKKNQFTFSRHFCWWYQTVSQGQGLLYPLKNGLDGCCRVWQQLNYLSDMHHAGAGFVCHAEMWYVHAWSILSALWIRPLSSICPSEHFKSAVARKNFHNMWRYRGKMGKIFISTSDR